MAALNRPTTANYEVHENVRVDTHDNEDHTFCGILFPIRVKQDLPISQLVLRSVSVRGRLGPMTVWVSNEDAPTGPPVVGGNHNNHHHNHAGGGEDANHHHTSHHFRLQSRYWTKVYERTHPPSMRRYQTLDFSDNPVILKPGTVRALYIHSTSEGDEAIVYDNTRHGFMGGGHWGARPTARRQQDNPPPRYQDNCLAIYTGKAHLSTRPFGQTNIWGWDNAWRDYREFVGQLDYGTVYQLWQPQWHTRFGAHFDQCARALLACQRRTESPMAMLPDECLFYILNMCRWDWFDDTGAALKEQRRLRKARLRALEAQEAARQAQEREREARLAEERTAREAVVAAAAAAAMESAPPSGCSLGPDAVETSASTCASAGGRDASLEFFDARQDPSEHMNPDNNDQEDEDEEMESPDHAEEEDDDDDDEEEWQEDEDDDDDDDGAESDDSDGWDRANGYRANPSYLSHRYVSSDEEEGSDAEDDNATNQEQQRQQAWFRRHFARIHVLRALAQAEHGGRDNNNGSDEDSDNENNANEGGGGREVYMRLD